MGIDFEVPSKLRPSHMDSSAILDEFITKSSNSARSESFFDGDSYFMDTIEKLLKWAKCGIKLRFTRQLRAFMNNSTELGLKNKKEVSFWSHQAWRQGVVVHTSVSQVLPSLSPFIRRKHFIFAKGFFDEAKGEVSTLVFTFTFSLPHFCFSSGGRTCNFDLMLVHMNTTVGRGNDMKKAKRRICSNFQSHLHTGNHEKNVSPTASEKRGRVKVGHVCC